MSHYTNKAGRVYITGMARNKCYNPSTIKTHLYDGDFGDPGLPMCRYGWTRMPHDYSYSIWRGNISSRGLCKTCVKRAEQGLNGVTIQSEEEKIEHDEIMDEVMDDYMRYGNNTGC